MQGIKKIIYKKIELINSNIKALKINKQIYRKRKKYNINIVKINHAGELSAQNLYYGQSYLIKDKYIKYFLLKSGKEEKKHLFWCLYYLKKNSSNHSNLYPVWKYFSFIIGIIPGFFNYKYNLGFLIETEIQVYNHLRHQIISISKVEYEILFILNKMLQDEIKHANNAIMLRSNEIPHFLKYLMDINSFIMINSASHI